MMTAFITRREACRILMASTACAFQVARGAEPDRAKFRLNYSLASSLYGTLPLEKILPEVRRLGCETIDLWPRPHGSQREQVEEMGHGAFQKLLDQNNVQLGMTTRYDLGAFSLTDEMSFVQKFGGRLIVTGARKGVGKSEKEQIQEFMQKMTPHVSRAEKLGVTIAIENHVNSLLESPDSLRYFAELSPSPHLGIAYAPYHLPQDPLLQAQLIEEIGPKLVHFYAWEHGDGAMKKLPKEQELKQLPGRGPFDFKPVLAALQKIGFSGWTQVFMHPVPRGIPIMESIPDIAELILESQAYLEQVALTGARGKGVLIDETQSAARQNPDNAR